MQRTPDAWVALPPDEAFPTRRGGYDFGFVPNMSRLIRAHPRIAEKWGPLFAEIMFRPGVLDRREKEMVAAVAAGTQDCHY